MTDVHADAVLRWSGVELRHGAAWSYLWLSDRLYPEAATTAGEHCRAKVADHAAVEADAVTVRHFAAPEVYDAQEQARRDDPFHPAMVAADYELVVAYWQPPPYGEGAPHPLCPVKHPHHRHPVAVIEPGPAAGHEHARIAQQECPGWTEPEPTPRTERKHP